MVAKLSSGTDCGFPSLHCNRRVRATGSACLANDHFAKHWQRRLQFVPYPFSQNFGSRIFKAGNLIQNAVINPFPNALERVLDITEIHHPADVIYRTRNMNFYLECVTVHPTTLVTGGYVWQPVCGVDVEAFEYFVKCQLTERTGGAGPKHQQLSYRRFHVG